MKLGDSSFWLAHALAGHPSNAAASTMLAQANPAEPICFCRSTQQSVLRLLTVDNICRSFGSPPFTNNTAWRVVQNYLKDPRIAFLQEPTGLESTWEQLAVRVTVSPRIWMDAYLAAFAISGGYEFVTADKGFKQFQGLTLVLL